ncbi:MAG: leucine-rich repeat domain-containing protein [Desulfuromonadales bacterium]|nr:leucine-rich repeat domain-containing protein [Desulfuromonadales bacterium]
MAHGVADKTAKEMIEDALKTGATELDLSFQMDDLANVAELPKFLSLLTQLTALNLSSNEFTELPEWLGQLTQLQSLDLSDNVLTELPEWLGQFTQLQSLSLSENELKELPEWMGQFTQLQSLHLHSIELTKLPNSMWRLNQLQLLDLSSNELTELPDWFRHLKQLQILNLSQNNLKKLPKSLGQLKQLQSLNISHNELVKLPESIGQLIQLQTLNLSFNNLTKIPNGVGQLKQLVDLELWINKLKELPESLTLLTNLRRISISSNEFTEFPKCICNLVNLVELYALNNQIENLPDSISKLNRLQILVLGGIEISWNASYAEDAGNMLTMMPSSLAQLHQLEKLQLGGNPLHPELAAAYEEGLDAVMRYLRAQAEEQVVLNEAKLILVGEGEVGKSCLLGALRGDPWVERESTHGIEIKPVSVRNPENGIDITLNGWDFGGQRVYRPTHQLFFSAPAVYLVVWKPREGPTQGFVKDWIKLVKHREPDAKILVVATHGEPGQRQPDIDRQEIYDLFGHETVLDFFHVDSKPDDITGEREGISELKEAITRVAASLPDMGRSVPARWQRAREALQQTGVAYLSFERVIEIFGENKMDEVEALDLVRISHRLGHLIHYEHDPFLRDIVILKPDWLATAISLVLDDKQTRDTHGLVSFSSLRLLWNDPSKIDLYRYPADVHFVFLRLMERFDLSYRVVGLSDDGNEGASLIAQLVPDTRPAQIPGWTDSADEGDGQQVQICQIVDAGSGQSATAEGLFYLLIVRLHKYSLGRLNFMESVHWQRGLVLDDDYNGRALLEYIGNDVRITVRAPYPERFLSVLTNEVKWLVESFWSGLRCKVMVPCVVPCGKGVPGIGLFEVQKLIESKKRNKPDYPCPVCDEWQNIDCLLRNAPSAQRTSIEVLFSKGFDEMRSRLDTIRELSYQHIKSEQEHYHQLDQNDRRIMSQVEDAFTNMIQILIDEAKDGPRLFSFQPVDPRFLDRPKWVNQKFRLTLWCEHSRLPLPALNGKDDCCGVYELDLPRDWFVKAAPFFKVLTGTLSLVLPVAASATKLALDNVTYKGIEKELDFGQKSIDSVLKGGEKSGAWLGHNDAPDLEQGEVIQAKGATLRQLHALLKEKDASFGGLVRVQNKRKEFLWVHKQFESEY